jgi:c-di-GMP-binding flagellar brake protein YcgR
VNLEEFLSLDDKLDVTLWSDTTQANSEDFHYRSSILDVQDGQILVYFPPEESAAFDWVAQGQKVRIVVTRSNGLWSFFPTIAQFVLKGSPRFWLKLPEDVEHLQRRKHVRVKHTFPLQITLEADALPTPATTPPPATSSNTLVGAVKPAITNATVQAIDVSAGGVRFKTEMRLTLGQLLSVSFKLTPQMGLITTLAKVVYCFSPDELPTNTAYALKVPHKLAGSKKEYITAVSFIDLPRDIEKRIIQECFHLELEQHRKGVR